MEIEQIGRRSQSHSGRGLIMSRQPDCFFSLTEFSAPRFLWLALSGRKPFILRLHSIIPHTKRWLDRLAGWAIRTGRARWAVELTPELKIFWRWDCQLYFKEVFAKYENWQNEYYQFDQARARDDDYSYGFMQTTCCYVYPKTMEIFLIDAIRQRDDGNPCKFFGVAQDTLDMCASYFGPETISGIRPVFVPRRTVNILLVILNLVYSAQWIVRRLRPSLTRKDVFAIVDCLGNAQEAYIAEELKDGGEVVLFDRTPGNRLRQSADHDAGYIHCHWGSGRFTIGAGMAALAGVAKDIALLGWRHRRLSPAHFFNIVRMPRNRIAWRGLFNVYRPAHFFGRDEYNSDHILRRPELHRIGGLSHGLSGAVYSGFASLAPNARYISYDFHYSMGVKLFDAYRSTWRKDMELRSIGLWGYRRKDLDTPRPSGDCILVTLRIAWEQPELLRMVHALAEAFPELTVLLQIKPVTFLDKDGRKQVVERYTAGHSNIVYTDDWIYDLLKRSRIHISDISTVVAESIHMGLFTFVADVLDQEYCMFREFPGLCATTTEELMERVKNTDMDPDSYPRNEYLARMGLEPNTNAYNVIRNVVELPMIHADDQANTESEQQCVKTGS